jgi:hypothetical protein
LLSTIWPLVPQVISFIMFSYQIFVCSSHQTHNYYLPDLSSST